MTFFTKSTSLVQACQQNNIDEVRRLLREGCVVDALSYRRIFRKHQGRTGLMIAAESGNVELVNLLLEAGAEPNRRNKGGCTALWLAASRGHTEVVHALQVYGASGELSGSDEPLSRCICESKKVLRETPLHRAVYGQQFQDICERLRCPSVSCVHKKSAADALLKTSLTMSMGRSSGAAAASTVPSTVTHFRCMVILLIEAGARLDAVDSHGRTPLQTAIMLGCASATRVLSQLHASLDACPDMSVPRLCKHQHATTYLDHPID